MNRRVFWGQAGLEPPDRACVRLDSRQRVEYNRTKVRNASKGAIQPMPRKRHTSAEQNTDARKPTPTFLLELPLSVTPGQVRRLRAHLEAARQLYNAVLSEGQRRLRRMRADPAWQEARAIPRTQKQERKLAFGALRQRYGAARVRAA